MMEVKYFKDLNHNYLIVKTRIREQTQNYQHKMITGNRIRNLLPCKIRYINEECHFYYEISSKQSIKNLFDIQEMEFGQLYRLFESIREAETETENFLLDSRCLILDPEYIYVVPETDEYFFVYYPYYMEETEDENGQSGMPAMLLAEFLVDRIKHTEAEAVDAVYKVYELIQDNKFIISEVMKVLEAGAGSGIIGDKETPAEKNHERSAEDFPDQDGYNNDSNNASNNDNGFEDCGGKSTDMQAGSKGNITAVGILSVLCMMAAAAIFCIGYFYTLSVEEKIISVAGIIILVILSGFFLVYFLFHFAKQKYGESKEENKQQSYPDSRKYIKPEEYYYPKADKKKQGINPPPGPPPGNETGEEYGNTVFLEAPMIRNENKLYGTNKGNKYCIDLSSLPCVIGKLAGSVDVIIKDKTISRIHAKISKSEEEIYITDMNSTNGTFKNGLRLEPNESVPIEPGDELRFGEMTFSYR